jgi:predicted Zn-dependent protease
VLVYLTVHFHQPEPAWQRVHTLADSLQYDKALETAKKLFEKDPNNPYGYAYVGNVQVAAGRIIGSRRELRARLRASSK